MIMRIGITQHRDKVTLLYSEYHIVLPNSLKHTLLEIFYGDTVSVSIIFLYILSILMMANMAIVSHMAQYSC